MGQFPYGKWRVKKDLICDNMFAQFRHVSGGKAYVKGIDEQAGLLSTGSYGKETRLTSVVVKGYTLEGRYRVLKPKSTEVKEVGRFNAKVRSNGSVRIKYTRASDWISRWHEEEGEPVAGTLRMNPANAGIHHQVRLKTIGLPLKVGASATLGNLEVRDLLAGWEKHYAIAALGVGVAGGVSLPIPSCTSWKVIDLAPRCIDWAGTTVEIVTMGTSAVVVSGGTIHLTLKFKNQKKVKAAKWVSKFGLDLTPKVELDFGTIARGKLLRSVVSRPYLSGA